MASNLNWQNWRSSNQSLSQTMGHLLESGLYSDVAFLVGPEREKVNAHKFILTSRSEIFATMFQERWTATTEENKQETITIPPDISLRNFKTFLKYLYTDEFKNNIIVTSRMLDVLWLAHLYEVPGLVSLCVSSLTERLSIQTCVDLHQQTILYDDISLSKDAFEYLRSNISIVSLEPQFLLLNVTPLKELLSSNNLDILEVQLFQALIRWSEDENPVLDENGKFSSRKSALSKLIRLIRYPLMGVETFAKKVVPTKLLTKQETIQMFVFFNGNGALPVGISAKPRQLNVHVFQVREANRTFALLEIRKTFLPKVWIPQLTFMADKPIMLQGIRFFGQALKLGNRRFKLSYRITSSVVFDNPSAFDTPPAVTTDYYGDEDEDKITRSLPFKRLQPPDGQFDVYSVSNILPGIWYMLEVRMDCTHSSVRSKMSDGCKTNVKEEVHESGVLIKYDFKGHMNKFSDAFVFDDYYCPKNWMILVSSLLFSTNLEDE